MRSLKIKTTFIFLMYLFSAQGSPAQLQIEPYKFKSKSGKTVDAELGKIKVPEDRAQKDSRQIDLHFIRFKSTNPTPSNPIIYLAGGPGGSGINAARGKRFELFMALREIGDVIALDQRGTGMSNIIPKCQLKADLPIHVPGTEDFYISKISETAKNCISFWRKEGVALDGYTTIQSTDDLEDLRKALREPKINLWGISYGSHLSFSYIKKYEHRVDKVILAGIEGLDQTIKLPNYNQNFLERLDTKLQADPVASKVYPNLLELMKKVLQRLDSNPVFVDITPPRNSQKVKVGISKLDVQLVTSFFLTKNPVNSRELPYLYYQMNKGDFSVIANMVMQMKLYARQVQAMPLVMDAASGVSKERFENKVLPQAQTAFLGRTTNFPFPDITYELELPNLGDAYRVNPKSSLPTLFFSGTLDGRTYLESADNLIKNFGNSSHVIIDGAGHDLYMSTPEVKELMLSFLKGKKVTSKTIQLEALEFVVPKEEK